MKIGIYGKVTIILPYIHSSYDRRFLLFSGTGSSSLYFIKKIVYYKVKVGKC